MENELARLGISVLERGWLSSNNILIRFGGQAAVVDTGYDTHAPQTVTLIAAGLKGSRLTQIVNTHLHSDHCGGNAALHATWGCEILVPSASFSAAASWKESDLSFRATGQRCARFPAHGVLNCGGTIKLGHLEWEIHPAPGHDPDAIMLFQPDHRILVSGDALWRHRVSVVFPELAGQSGFSEALQALDAIERMAPCIVIPGHGPPFNDASYAIKQSRERLLAFGADPVRHHRYAVRALAMFHMLEQRRKPRSALIAWIQHMPLLSSVELVHDRSWVDRLVSGLETDGALRRDGDWLCVVPNDRRPDS